MRQTLTSENNHGNLPHVVSKPVVLSSEPGKIPTFSCNYWI